MNAKNILRSKTFWVQVIAFGASFYPPIGAWVAANPETALAALGAVNVLVRFATSGKVTIFQANDDNGGGSSGGASGGNVLPLLCCVCTAVALMTGLPSCAMSKTTAPDGTVTETQRPDAEAIEQGFSVARWAGDLWLALHPPKAPEVEVVPSEK
jgi:hypothetical protein